MQFPYLKSYLFETIEVGRVLYVGGLVVPGVELAAGSVEVAPVGAAVVDLAVDLLEHGRYDPLLLDLPDLGPGRPDVPQEDLLALLGAAQGLPLEVYVHRSGYGVGYHQEGRGQVVGTSQRVDSALEVTVSRQHAAADELVLKKIFLVFQFKLEFFIVFLSVRKSIHIIITVLFLYFDSLIYFIQFKLCCTKLSEYSG